jgi:hypothetical protein
MTVNFLFFLHEDRCIPTYIQRQCTNANVCRSGCAEQRCMYLPNARLPSTFYSFQHKDTQIQWQCTNAYVVKSEAIACARRCRSSQLTGWWTRKEKYEKIGDQGEGEAQEVADPPPQKKCQRSLKWLCRATPDVHSLLRIKRSRVRFPPGFNKSINAGTGGVT